MQSRNSVTAFGKLNDSGNIMDHTVYKALWSYTLLAAGTVVEIDIGQVSAHNAYA